MNNLSTRIAEIRAERDKLLDRIHAIESASVPKNDLLAAMRSDIETKAKNYRERADALIEDWRRGERSPAHLLERIIAGTGEPVAYPWQIENLLCFLFAPEIVKSFMARIDALDFKGALAVEGRNGAIEKLKKEIFTLEIREEALVKGSESSGHQVMRRPDVRGDVVLGLVGD